MKPEQFEERLAQLDLRRPVLNKRRAERAVGAHLAALRLEPRPVRWIDDPAQMNERWKSPGCAAWLYRFSRRRPTLPPRRASRRRAFDGYAGSRIDASLFEAAIPSSQFDTNPYRISFSALVSEIAVAAPALAAKSDDPRVRERLTAVAPFVTLLESGVLELNVRERFVQVLPRPYVAWERGQVHRWDGYPAVWWPSGTTELYVWRGVHMTAATGSRPEELTARRIASWRNAERRRVAIDRMGGMEAFLEAGGARLVAQDDFGKLWQTGFQVDGERYTAVEVVNATAESDGTYRRFFLRVPPTTRTARAAVAWTFGFDSARGYMLAHES